MSFLKRKKRDSAVPPPPMPVHEEVTAQEYQLRLAYVARSSDGLRLRADPAVAMAIPGILEPLSQTPVEVIEPLPLEYSDASPAIERFNEMQQWVLARRDVSPIGRHGLYVLEITDALDMTVDTFFCGLLHGDPDTSGYPEYNAIVGGLASHWDELSGELIVRAVIGWGCAATPSASARSCSAPSTSRWWPPATASARRSRRACRRSAAARG